MDVMGLERAWPVVCAKGARALTAPWLSLSLSLSSVGPCVHDCILGPSPGV